jgi:hypothetical protein
MFPLDLDAAFSPALTPHRGDAVSRLLTQITAYFGSTQRSFQHTTPAKTLELEQVPQKSNPGLCPLTNTSASNPHNRRRLPAV